MTKNFGDYVEVLGEASKRIPKFIRDQYPQVPWKKMTGMRDKLIHEYSGVDFEIIWQVMTKELPVLKPTIKKILSQIDRD